MSRVALGLLESRGEGLATYALAVDDLEGDVAALQADGSPIGTPVAGARARPGRRDGPLVDGVGGPRCPIARRS